MDDGIIQMIFVIGAMAVLAGFVYWNYRRNLMFNQRLKRLRPQRTSYADVATAKIVSPSSDKGAFQDVILFITDKEVLIYPENGSDETLVTFRSDEIIGYWRPRPYHGDKLIDMDTGWRSKKGSNEINIHANVNGQWVIIKLWVKQAEAKKIVKRLKGLVSEDILRSYRQRPPYIYHPPSPALLMSEDLYGIWYEDHRFRLYLTPSTLVFLDDKDDVIERMIYLRDIQNVRLLQQKGDGDKDGLICFDLENQSEQIAVAVDGSDKWARSIARAARRTLDDPIDRKQKDKKPLDDQWVSDDFDMKAWEEQEYILGDDGELKPVKGSPEID